MNTSMQIGFSQRIQLDWLEHTAALVLAGQTREQIDAALQGFLSDKLSVGGTAERGNREKAITILLRIWVSVPPHLKPFRKVFIRPHRCGLCLISCSLHGLPKRL